MLISTVTCDNSVIHEIATGISSKLKKVPVYCKTIAIIGTCKRSLSRNLLSRPKNCAKYHVGCSLNDFRFHMCDILHNTEEQNILFLSSMQEWRIHQLSLKDCASQFLDEGSQALLVEVVIESTLSQESIQ